MTMKIIIETMCDSLRDCIVTEQTGANRIELNSGTHLGGLTPSLGLLQSAKDAVNIPIVTMIRCRMGGFVYNELELQTMKKDAQIMLENGADGIVFGFLNDDLTIDEEATLFFVELAHHYGKEAIFHRAFDRVIDPISRSEEHTSELQSRPHLVCRLLLEKKNKKQNKYDLVLWPSLINNPLRRVKKLCVEIKEHKNPTALYLGDTFATSIPLSKKSQHLQT